MEDERKGLPSASSMPRLHGPNGCLGSFLLEAHLSEKGNKAAANRGEKIHAVLEGKIPVSALNHSDRICYERTAFEESRLVEAHGMEGAEQIKEQRFWVGDAQGDLFSAKPDVVHLLPEKALVLNYKTGFYLPHAIAENAQMLAEGSAIAYHYPRLEQITIGLIHPNAPLEDDSIAQTTTFTMLEMLFHLEAIKETSRRAILEDAPFNPNPQACQWCRGVKRKACAAYFHQQNPTLNSL